MADSVSPMVGLSVFDRLTDDHPNASHDPSSTLWEHVRQFKRNLCRDLTALLNTRRAERDFDPGYEEATNSLLTFGITDFTSHNLKNTIEQDDVRLAIERAIRRFEPRLSQVEVSVVPPDPLRLVLQFQIAAVLRTDLALEEVLLDATLHRESRRISVSGGGE